MTQRRSEEKLTEIVRKYPDRLGVCPLLGDQPYLCFHGTREESLVTVVDGGLDLL